MIKDLQTLKRLLEGFNEEQKASCLDGALFELKEAGAPIEEQAEAALMLIQHALNGGSSFGYVMMQQAVGIVIENKEGLKNPENALMQAEEARRRYRTDERYPEHNIFTCQG